MKLVRFQPPDSSARLGVAAGGKIVDIAPYLSTITARTGMKQPVHTDSLASWLVAGWLDSAAAPKIQSIASEIAAGAICLRPEDVRLLPPVDQGCQVFGVGRNFEEHAKERGASVTSDPLVFLKSSSSLIGCGAPVLVSEGIGRVDHEGELAVVIGARASDVPEAEAGKYIAGYTCLNDVTARDLQNADAVRGWPWYRAKGRSTYGPIGPWLVTADEFDADPALDVVCRVNGDERQRGNTSQMTHSIRRVISYLSSICPLLPGDVIAMGTPAGIGPLMPGDVVEVEVSGIGVLSNPVEAAS